MDNCVVCGERLDDKNECWKCAFTEPLRDRIAELEAERDSLRLDLALMTIDRDHEKTLKESCEIALTKAQQAQEPEDHTGKMLAREAAQEPGK